MVAQDGYQGYCLYWEDDGSPAASTLIHGDGSGDPDNDQKRPAIYGDDETDDVSLAAHKDRPNADLKSMNSVLPGQTGPVRPPLAVTPSDRCLRSLRTPINTLAEALLPNTFLLRLTGLLDHARCPRVFVVVAVSTRHFD